MEAVVNNYEFAKILDEFEEKEVKFLSKKVDEAFVILNDPKHVWRDDDQKLAARAKYDAMERRYNFLREFHTKAKKLVKQHEGMTDQISGLYQMWHDQISNEGRQEAEMMSEQAKILGEIFQQIYLLLEPLKLNLKPPKQ